jgi:hypothetical protein
MNRWRLLALAVVPLVLSVFRPPPGPDLVWWTTHSLDKIHPYDREPQEPVLTAKISAARNEFEPFQVVLRAAKEDIDGVDIEVADLRGASGVIPSKNCVSIYLERYLDVTIPSSIAGGTGDWPDPLIPRVDRYANEQRNAFPFKLLKGRNQPVWVDVYIPPSSRAGRYSGQVHVLRAGKILLSIPIELEVWDFQLPSTSTLITTFGFSGNSALRAHYGKYTNDKDLFDLTSIYQKAALWHRISLEGSSGVGPTIAIANGDVQLNWDKYDDEMAPFMDGRVFSADQPLAGAKATSAALHTPQRLKTPEQQIQYWRQAAEHFRQKGWFDRLFNYLWDEPKEKDYPAMLERGEVVRRADPTVRNLVTAPLHPDWSRVIDIWSPVINCFERKGRHSDYCHPMVELSAYDSELAKGKQLWWYQACSSHGCFILGGDYFTGWPSYMIDDAPVRNRIMEWMTWKYGIKGELYFSVDDAYWKKNDPWKDVYLFGGNGDGTLFYPGRPDVIGGKTDIPIESIRLKLIREGLEDYEYLNMLSKLKGYKAVSDSVNGIIRNTYDFDQDPRKLYAVRQWIGQQLSAKH